MYGMGCGSLLVKVVDCCSEGCEFKSYVHKGSTVGPLKKGPTLNPQLYINVSCSGYKHLANAVNMNFFGDLTALGAEMVDLLEFLPWNHFRKWKCLVL